MSQLLISIMKRPALILSLLVLLSACATTNVPESDRTRILDASPDAVMSAAVTYLGQQGYAISQQFPPTEAMAQGQVVTRPKQDGDYRSVVTCVIHPKDDTTTELTVRIIRTQQDASGEWHVNLPQRSEFARQHRDMLRGIEELL